MYNALVSVFYDCKTCSLGVEDAWCLSVWASNLSEIFSNFSER